MSEIKSTSFNGCGCGCGPFGFFGGWEWILILIVLFCVFGGGFGNWFGGCCNKE